MNIGRYESLITDRNSKREKFMEYVRSILTPGINSASVVDSTGLSFEVDNAAGAQLDVLGELVGVKRLLDYEPSIGNREMDDDEFRLCVKLAIVRNEWDGSNESVFSSYQKVFGADFDMLYYDNQDMSVTMTVVSELSIRMIEIIHHAGTLLVPAGVRVGVQISGSDVALNALSCAEVTGTQQVDCVVAT